MSISETEASSILRVVQFDSGFHFCMENGVYTKISAISLVDFFEKLIKIDINSVQFHFPRGDFQAWIKETLGDKELAQRISNITPDLSPETHKKKLLNLVKTRILELSRISRHRLAGLFVDE